MQAKIRRTIEWLRHHGVLSFAVIALFIFSFRSVVADWNHVPTGSMNPTILEGDTVFVNRLAYDVRVPFTTISLYKRDDPAYADVIIFYSPENGDRLVKRVIARPGDTVEVRQGLVMLNGKPLHYNEIASDESKAQDRYGPHHQLSEFLGGRGHEIFTRPHVRDFGPVVVPAEHYFVMGDHRDNSADSRYIGFIPRGQILGRATGILVSLNSLEYYQPRWQRFFEFPL